MTQKEKLYEMIVDKENELFRGYPYTTDEFRIDAIAEHLIDNGVIVLPCKVGDTVYDTEYGSIYGKGERIMPCVVRRIITSQLIVVKPEGYEDKRYVIQSYSFGSSTFLTREEAEEALKGCERK